MLPNLSGISPFSLHSKPLNGVRDVGVRLAGLPGELLAKVIGDAGKTARTLCATADRLLQTSKDFANHEAWLALANEYEMPDTPTHPRPPSGSDDVEKWKRFVLSWCDDIRVGKIEVGPYPYPTTYVRRALLREQRDGNRFGYQWLMDHGDCWGRGGWGGLDGNDSGVDSRWMLDMAMKNVTIHKKFEILELQLYHLDFSPSVGRWLGITAELFEGAVGGMEVGNLDDSVTIVAYLFRLRKGLAQHGVHVAVDPALAGEEAGPEYVDSIVDDAYDTISQLQFNRLVLRQEKFLQMVVPRMEGEGLSTYETTPDWFYIVIRPPTPKAIIYFLRNTLRNNQLETANWFFTRHKNLIGQYPDVLMQMESYFEDVPGTDGPMGSQAKIKEMVDAWRREIKEIEEQEQLAD
jgi:hypothetical protein